MNKTIGFIGVDAGLCWIGDPCYVLPDDSSEREVVKDWGEFCDVMQDQTHVSWSYTAGHEGLGVCVSTGGDGCYPVVADIGEDGSIRSVTITFEEEED